MEILKKRIRTLTIALLVLAAAVSCRLAYIQLAGHEELSAAEHSQSLISLVGSNTRGIIYDRNGAPLVADRKHYIYVISKGKFDYQTAKLLKSFGAAQVQSGSSGYYVYSSDSYDRRAGEELVEKYDAYIIYASSRYSDDQLAAHLIGYVNESDDSGASGLELMFNSRLDPLHRHMYAVADVRGNLIPERGIIVTSDESSSQTASEGIRTTVDKGIQQAVEDILDKQEKNCAAVVMDCSTGGIAALACTPKFDPDHVSSYIEGRGSELVNKATQGEYPPGSVFKIIVAAAALESGATEDRTFTCKGSVKSGSHSIKCDTGGSSGHGRINMKDAFAYSCNSYFVQLGKELGSDRIISMAEKFHLGETALENYPQESAGHLMDQSQRQGAAVGNLSIGQGETLVTPLQIARVTSVIANGGTDKGVSVLMDDEQDNERVISEDSAKTISGMMSAVTEYGTAASLDMKDSSGSPETAVKTGTAQYGSADSYGTHAWITGFAPCSQPEYTVTVLVEDGNSGAASAGPVYREIIEYLKRSGSYSRPALALSTDWG